MSSPPTVVVKKGGVLTALVSGIFGTLIVCIVCAAALALYALNTADRKFSEFLSSGKTLLDVVPELRGSLSVLADTLDDQRTPEYREQLETSVHVVPAPAARWGQVAVVEVRNRGPETVTFLTARLVVADERDVPLREHRVFVATPLGFDHDEWRGPLLPGSARRFAVELPDCSTDQRLTASLEITDLRIWNKNRTREAVLPVPETPAPNPP